MKIFCTGLAMLALVGCGPLHHVPMPARPDEEMQAKIDASWEKALSPVNHLDRQHLLDVLIASGAYQFGVDRLQLSSEKRFSGGKVVMQVTFDRAKPMEDQFTIQVFDSTGTLVRSERYDRTIIEKTFKELNDRPADQPKDGPHDAELAKKRAAYEARWAEIEAVFPKLDEDKK